MDPSPSRRLFNRALTRWHATHRRDLAVRRTNDPWAILVAEVMSQQTQIERIGPAWGRFVARWPAPSSLATSGTRDLLQAWAGLGYNRRALALREAARSIVRDHDGSVPSSVQVLERLPGIGPSPKQLQVEADALVSRRDPRGWLDGVMDLAATVCTPRAPRCAECPLRRTCATRGVDAKTGSGSAAPRFASTNRWLRGRLLAAVREAPSGAWIEAPDGLGEHDRVAVHAALRGLERDGFVELRDGRARLALDG